ncbi:MFS transporter [Parasphingorhabdus sp.]|uniref:MFS transporter n=1 Tax=Parasphingorhabdus sp. TaxID=2709688 RepID=UPI003A94F1DD
MSWYQYMIIAICVLTYAADGLDVVTLSYAAPVMMKEWNISPETFGFAYSATPVGIALGSFFIAPLADKIGRRVLVLWLLGLLIIFMLATASSTSMLILVILRFVTGVCLGALVVCLNVTVSEFSNEKRSNFHIGLLHTGYSFGSMLCGGLAAILIEPYGWRSIFYAAAILNIISFVLAVIILAESPAFLINSRRKNSLQKLNRQFRLMKHAEYEELPLPKQPSTVTKDKAMSIIPRSLWASAIFLSIAGFFFTTSGAFMASWKPHLLDMSGLEMTQIGIAGMFSSGAGVIAHLVVGALARNVGEFKIAIIFLIATACALILFGIVPNGAMIPLTVIVTVWGFFNIGSYTAIILVTINHYDVSLRNAGLGIMLGCSRIGGILGPLLGGVVIGTGADRLWVLCVFSAILAVPVVALLIVWGSQKKPIAENTGKELMQ